MDRFTLFSLHLSSYLSTSSPPASFSTSLLLFFYIDYIDYILYLISLSSSFYSSIRYMYVYMCIYDSWDIKSIYYISYTYIIHIISTSLHLISSHLISSHHSSFINHSFSYYPLILLIDISIFIFYNFLWTNYKL